MANSKNKETRIQILKNRIRAAEIAWQEPTSMGKSGAAAYREMFAALDELKKLTA